MNIGIDMGHPFNCGAFGIMSETNGNRAVGRFLIAKLKELGHTVIDCTYDTNVNELANRVALANAQSLDYFISLHMDCYDNASANGVTIYTTENSSAKAKAVEIINLVADSCNYNNRGWKSADYYVLKNTKAPAMLLEMGFVSNQGDCNKFNAEAITNAVIKGLTGQNVQTNTNEKGYIVTTYLPHSLTYDGIDINYVLSYFKDVKCYVRGNAKGVWIETEYLPIDKCNELKSTLGSWFYSIEK